MRAFIHLMVLAALLSQVARASDEHNHAENEGKVGVEALSPGLRDLLAREMQALQGGMMSIIPAYVSGDWHKIATTAGKIKASYILKQSLTQKQKKELHAVLPDAFIARDQAFHAMAGKLEQAASNQDAELVNFYFSKMNASCVDCHREYATHKFPSLIAGDKNLHEH